MTTEVTPQASATRASSRRATASVTATPTKEKAPESPAGDQDGTGSIEHMPDNFPAAAKEAVAAALNTPVVERTRPVMVPGLPEAPLSLNFRVPGPRALDMQLTVRAMDVKGLTALYLAVMETFLPLTEEYGYRFPGMFDPEVTEQDPDNFSQPAGFPQPPNHMPQQVPAPAQQVPQQQPSTWQPPQYHAPSAAAPQQWAQPAYPPQASFPQAPQQVPQQAAKQKGSFMLVRLVMASTRNGAPQLQAFGPNGEKATTGLKAEILAKKCECLGFTMQHFQMINVELYNVAMPGAPRVTCNWSQRPDSKYMDFEGLQLAQ